jgi:hypothetical protein
MSKYRKFWLNGTEYVTDGRLTLPTIAGAQEGGFTFPGEESGGGEIESFVGQTVYNPANVNNQYRIERGGGGGLMLVNTRTGGRAVFRGGTFVTADGRQVQIDPQGNGLGRPRQLSQTELRNYQTTGTTAFSLEDMLGGAGGGGGSATVVGARAPDPGEAARLLLDHYDRLVQQGQITREAALAEFTSNLDRAARINADIRERQIAEASRAVRMAEEAGSRARTVAQEILPRSIPGAESITLPLLGTMPINQVDVDQLFNQGLPALADLPAISQTPAVAYPGEFDFGEIQMPALPNIGAYAQQAAGGFGGWRY